MSQDCHIETASPRQWARGKKKRATRNRLAKPAASKRPARGKSEAAVEVASERFTPLLSREHYTFSRMRSDRGGPRSYSAICLPGWIRA